MTGAGGGGEQYLTYIYPTSSADCPGDSGDPRTYGAFTSAAAIWGINSGYYGDGSDAVADATYYGYNVLDPVRKFGVPPQAPITSGCYPFRSFRLWRNGPRPSLPAAIRT